MNMKRIIYRYLAGFAFGVMMLVLCLLLTYTVGGQNYYEEELAQMQMPSSLLLQTIWSGILYVCITITIINTHEFLTIKDNDVTVQYLLMYVIHLTVIIFVSFLSQEYGNFGLGTYSLVFGLGMIMLMIGTLADMAQNVTKLIRLKKKVFYIKAEPETKKLSDKAKAVLSKSKAK